MRSRRQLHQKPTSAQTQLIPIAHRDDKRGRLAIDRQTRPGEVDEKAPRSRPNEDGMDPGNHFPFDSQSAGAAPSQKRQLRKHRGCLIGIILGPQHQRGKGIACSQRVDLR